MAKFKDKDGQEWSAAFTVGDIGPLKKELGLDLKCVLVKDDTSLVAFVSDPEKVVQLMWFLCQKQAEKLGLAPDDFARRFDGETIENASAAAFEATYEYFPQLRKAAKRVGTAFREVMGQTGEAAEKMVDEAAARMRAELTSKLSALSLEDSAGLTPAP